MYLSVQSASGVLLAGKARKEMEFDSAEPKVRGGLYSYLVPVVVFDGERAETLDVTVEAGENPVGDDVKPGTPMRCQGMRISFGTYTERDSGKQRKYWRLCCDSIAPAAKA